MKDKPNKVTAVLKVVVTGEFYDEEASEETLRYCIEQDLEDVGFDVEVELLKEQEPVEAPLDAFGHPYCPKCKVLVYQTWHYCPHCGKAVQCNERPV